MPAPSQSKSPTSRSGKRPSAVITTALKTGEAVLGQVRRRRDHDPDAVRVLTIAADAEELRGVLTDQARLSHVLAEPYTGDPSPWTVEVSERVEDRVRFRAHSGAQPSVTATGSASFAPAPQDLGTEVRLALDLEGPDLAAGAMAHKVLRRLKALAETGEIPTLAHNSSARHDPGDASPDDHHDHGHHGDHGDHEGAR